MKNYLFLFACMLLPALLSIPVGISAQQLEEDPRAREIFTEVDRRRDRVTHEQSDMRMVIYDPRGRTRNREIRSYSYNSGEISKSLLIFEAPANVRGTGFLTISEGSDEIQKLFLPALGRIQVISASEKSDRFMGSDFTYEDLGDQDPADYRFALRAETDTAYVLDAEKKEQSQYDRLVFYIDPERYVLQRIEYFDGEGAMIKRLEASGYRQVMDDVWRSGRMVMYDLQNDRKTELSWSNRVIGDPIPDWRFTERGLWRGAD